MLLAPDVVSRAAARRAALAEERWMLRQPRSVRASYVAEVLDGSGDPELRRQLWMLHQNDAVRRSYASEVLEPALVADQT